MSEACPFLDAIKPEHRADPYPLYADVPKVPTRLQDGRYVVTGYQAVLSLLHDRRLTSAAGDGKGPNKRVDLLRLDPPEHDRLRRVMMRQFGPPNRPRLVGDLEGEIIEAAHALVDGLEGKAEADLVEHFAHPLPLSIIRKLMDIPEYDESKFRVWVDTLTASTGSTDRTAESVAAGHDLSAYLADMANGRRGGNGTDMLTGLVNDDGPEGGLPAASVGPMASLLLIAGHETTVNLISNGILTLLRHPEEISLLQGDPLRSVRIVEELLRYEPPVQFIQSRTAMTNIEVEGVAIPAGSGIVLVVAAANRDAARFDRADCFDPDRADNQHLGFGSGIHSCFGAPLARLEGQIALRVVFERLVNPCVAMAPRYRTSALLRGPSQLVVSFDAVRPRSADGA